MNGNNINLQAVVALLTRNIKIEGEDYDNLFSESFGARVLVGENFIDGESHSGMF